MRSFLIVDDSQTVLLTLRSAIRHARGKDATVSEARDAASALEIVRDTAPDFVFLDLVMPDAAGEPAPAADDDKAPAEGLRLLRAIVDRRPQTKVIVITGLPANHPDVVDAVSLGAVAVLRKPVRPDDVRVTLEALEPGADALSYFG